MNKFTSLEYLRIYLSSPKEASSVDRSFDWDPVIVFRVDDDMQSK